MVSDFQCLSLVSQYKALEEINKNEYNVILSLHNSAVSFER